MSDTKLILVPLDPAAPVPERARVTYLLDAIGLTGAPTLVVGEPRLTPGPEFTKLLSFQHTHEVVSLVNTPDGLVEAGRGPSPGFCTITVPEPTAEIQFCGSASTETPSCRHCDLPVEDWPDVVDAWYESKDIFQWSCPRCAKAQAVWELDWHHASGFGSFRIEVWGVHEGEAVPTPALLSALAEAAGCEWTYFYYRF